MLLMKKNGIRSKRDVACIQSSEWDFWQPRSYTTETFEGFRPPRAAVDASPAHHRSAAAAATPSSEAASQQEETSHQRLSLQALFSHCSHSLPRVSQTFQYFMGRVCPAPSCPVLDASVSSQHPARAQPHRESISRIKMRHAKPSKAGLSTWQRFREFLLSPLVNSAPFA